MILTIVITASNRSIYTVLKVTLTDNLTTMNTRYFFLPAIRKLTRCMKYPQDLNSLQLRTNAIRHDIACFWNDEFVCSGQPTRMVKRRIFFQ